MAQVSVSRGALLAMAAALGAALLAVAFLLGREAGRRGGPSAAQAAPPSAPGFPAPSAVTAAPKSEAVPPPARLDPVPEGAADPQDPMRAAVQAYFAAMDRIAPGQASGDPQALAQDMLAGLAKGDASGFDRMMADSQKARRRLAQLAPPPPCAAFHQESLALLDENLALLRAMRSALAGGSPEESSLTTLAARAQAAQARAEALAQADRALRGRYGAGR
ncbi:MAG: hypothetical protein U0P81_00990 [Holophagaceae bacterium]